MKTERIFKTSDSPNDSIKRVMFTNDKVISNEDPVDTAVVELTPDNSQRRTSVYILNQLTDIKRTGLGVGERCSYWFFNKVKFLRRKWFTHCFLIVVMLIYTYGGALIFLTVEGQNEHKLIESDIKVQVDELLHELRKKSLSEPKKSSGMEWIGEASRKIADCEKIITNAFDKHPLVVSNTNGKVWTLRSSIMYCATLYTTIGYGHLYPTTFTGRVLTIVYSTIGIPLFLIAVTDFGKLLTRCIKFFWSYIRLVYYTGRCRRVRRTSHVQEIMKGAQTMYEYATFRRFSTFVNSTDADEHEKVPPKADQVIPEPPTPAISNFEIDDEFNLPVSLALCILISYMLVGTVLFVVVDKWEFFDSFYFIFTSMSTIGFGDIIPGSPFYMIYLCLGLTLMSMCINVVQDKLSDTFSRASVKLGTTMGVTPNEENEDVITPQAVQPVNYDDQIS